MSDNRIARVHSLLRTSRRLQAQHFDGLVPIWEGHWSDFIMSGKPVMVVEGGRRSFKSTSALVFGSDYVMSGPWRSQLSKGERGVWAIIAQNIDTGKYLLSRMRAMLDALGVQFESETTERLALRDLPIECKVYACNEKSFLSRTIVGCFCDEVAEWKQDETKKVTRAKDDADSDSSFAAEVIAALEPAMATITGAPLILCSAPKDPDTYHHARFLEGNTDRQMVVHVPTWLANAKLPEAECRKRAGSERNFQLRYAAIPQDSKESRPFERSVVDHALARDFDRGHPIGKRVVCADPSSGTGGDSFVHIIAGYNQRSDGTRVLCVDWAEAERGKWAHRKGGADVCKALADDAKRFGAELVATDQRETLLMTTELPRHGLKVQVFPHTTESKTTAVERLQLLLAEGQLALPQRNGERIKKQLLDFQQSETRTGLKRFASRQSAAGGDDLVAALLTLMLADGAGLLEGSPNARTRRKDPKPRAIVEPSQWASESGSSLLDRVHVDQRHGRLTIARRARGTFEGGGF